MEGSPPGAPLNKQMVCPGESKLYLKENTAPVVNPPWRIPESVKSKLKEKLHKMEKDSIIAKITHPSYRVNSIVLVEKLKQANSGFL